MTLKPCFKAATWKPVNGWKDQDIVVSMSVFGLQKPDLPVIQWVQAGVHITCCTLQEVLVSPHNVRLSWLRSTCQEGQNENQVVMQIPAAKPTTPLLTRSPLKNNQRIKIQRRHLHFNDLQWFTRRARRYNTKTIGLWVLSTWSFCQAARNPCNRSRSGRPCNLIGRPASLRRAFRVSQNSER